MRPRCAYCQTDLGPGVKFTVDGDQVFEAVCLEAWIRQGRPPLVSPRVRAKLAELLAQVSAMRSELRGRRREIEEADDQRRRDQRELHELRQRVSDKNIEDAELRRRIANLEMRLATQVGRRETDVPVKQEEPQILTAEPEDSAVVRFSLLELDGISEG